MDQKSFGQHIKFLRKSKNLSRQELADVIGISFYSIAEYELGRKLPSLSTFCNIAKALNVTPNELLSTEFAD